MNISHTFTQTDGDAQSQTQGKVCVCTHTHTHTHTLGRYPESCRRKERDRDIIQPSKRQVDLDKMTPIPSRVHSTTPKKRVHGRQPLLDKK